MSSIVSRAAVVSSLGPSAPEQMFAALKERMLSINHGCKRHNTRRLRNASRRAMAALRDQSLRHMAHAVLLPAWSSSAAYTWTHGSSAIHPLGTSNPYNHTGDGK